ncbi:MAG: FliH/SctL family protein [Alphaproteobacteria bacterium]|nr:FliH/SctL family protein [Alphaproteobacteria bacterium]
MMDTQTQTAENAKSRKYLFDLTFDNGQNKMTDPREKPTPTYSQEQLDSEKQASFEAGMQAGQKSMMEDQQQYMNTLLSQIDQRLSHVIQESTGEWQRQLVQLQELALIITRKIMPSYIEKYGLTEIETVVSTVLGEVSREPRLVFRVNEGLFDEVSAKINSIAQQQAYAGKIVILGDPEIGTSDCRIEWADGGIERNVQTLWQSIERVMSEAQTFETTQLVPNPDAHPPLQEQPPLQETEQQPMTEGGESP